MQLTVKEKGEHVSEYFMCGSFFFSTKLLEGTCRSLVCHGKHKLLELVSGAFPQALRSVQSSATATFLCVLPLRPSEYLGDNSHVVNKEEAVEAAQT